MRTRFTTFIFLLLSPVIWGQEVLQEEVVNLQTKGTVRDVFDAIAQQCNLSFAYNNKLIDDTDTVIVNVQTVPLYKVLIDIVDTSKVKIVSRDRKVIFTKRSTLFKKIDQPPPVLSRQLIGFILSGSIRDADTRETLIGAHISIRSIKTGTNTDVDGYYAMRLPPGEYAIQFSFIGYTSIDTVILLNKSTQFNISLHERTYALAALIKDEAPPQAVEYVYMSKVDIPIQELEAIPSLLGERDVFRAFQMMPGVQGGREGQGGLYVRGGSSDQNLILLEGIPLYRPQHLLGAISALDGQVLKNIELIKGGFPARYGGRLSAVMDMRMKEGNKSYVRGSMNLGLLAMGGSLEVPIRKNKSSILLSGRRFFWDLLLPVVARAADEDISLSYNFHDLYFKYDDDIDTKNKLSVHAFWLDDATRSGSTILESIIPDSTQNAVNSESRLRWGNIGSGIRWRHQHSAKTIFQTTAHYSQQRFRTRVVEDVENIGTTRTFNQLTNSIYDLGLDFQLINYTNLMTDIRLGAAYNYRIFRPQLIIQVKENQPVGSSNISERLISHENSFFGEYNRRIGTRFRFHAGLRLMLYQQQQLSNFSLLPRLSISWKPVPQWNLKASFARTQQNMHLVGNSGIQLPTDLWLPADEDIQSAQATQFAIGAVVQLDKHYELSSEVYHKRTTNIVNLLPGGSYAQLFTDEIDRYFNQENLAIGQAQSTGWELLFRKRYGRLNGWIAYTLSWTKNDFPDLAQNTFWSDYDQRHTLSVTAAYQLSEHWKVSGSWVYASGNPYTLPTSRYQYTDPQTGQKRWVWVNDEKNNARGRAYHRLDLSLQNIKTFNKIRRTFSFGLFNAYARANPFLYDVNFFRPDTPQASLSVNEIRIFPLLPSLSLRLELI